MILAEFVLKAASGKLPIRYGGASGGTLVSKKGTVKLTDPETITAEAFAQEVATGDWDQVLAQVTSYLKQRAAGGAGSGNFGHEGRPGEVGGSGEGGGGPQERIKSTGDRLNNLEAKLVEKNGGPLTIGTGESGKTWMDPETGFYHNLGGSSAEQMELSKKNLALDRAVKDGKITAEEKAEYVQAFSNREHALIEGDDTYYNKQRVEIANSWKQSSTSYGSTHMKVSAMQQWGAKGVVYNPANYQINPLELARTDAVMKRMYRETQEDVRNEFKMGVTNPESPGWDGKKINLYRGMHGNKGIAGGLEAWSASRNSARNFGRTRQKSFRREQILTYHRSRTWRGEGAMQYHEQEYIIIRGMK